MTTTFNLGQHNTGAFMGRRVEAWGQPLTLPSDIVADGANSVELAVGTLMLRIAHVAGEGLYVKTGLAGADALTVGNGAFFPIESVLPFQVGVEPDGTRHTHLYYINSDA